MKSDLISRTELFNRLADKHTKAEIYAVINDMPTVDNTADNFGTWIIYNPEDIGTTNCRCSNCRTEFFFPAIETRPYTYCPECGARMMALCWKV